MGTSSKLAGVRLEDYNHLKYTIGVSRVGQEVFSHVFTWGFIGGSGSIKDALFSLPQYSQAKFRKDFNASQRDKITKGVPVSEFDITLTYKLLQLVCGLSEANDSVWVTETSDSLEYCLYVIKSKRNETAHESVRLSPTKMVQKLEDLRKLFVSTIQKAEQRYSVDSSKVKTLQTSITHQLDAIEESPVPLTTVAEYQKELQASRKACVIEEGINESTQIFDRVCQVSVVPWLITGRTVNVAKVFTHPILKRDETQIIQRQLSASESYVSVCDVLQATDCDGTRPDVTMISALNGMGKSTLLKFILDRGINDVVARGDIDNFDLILLLECRHAAFSSLNEMAALLLPRTASKFQQSEFKQTLFSLELLLIVDDLNELDQKSFSIFKDFLNVMTPGTRVLAMTSREKAKDLQRSISALHKKVLFLEIEGIPEDQTLPFLQRTLNHVSPETAGGQDSERKLCQLISSKRLSLQEHLRSPEVLSLIALSWALAPDGLNTSTTVTEIFMLVEDLLIHKVLQNLLGSSLPGISTKNALASKLRKYLTSLSSVAAACTRNGKFTIDSEYLMKLGKDCQSLELPEEYMISAFLNYTEECGGVSMTPSKVSFPRRSTIVYYAAWYMSQNLRDAPASRTIRQCLGLQSSVAEDHVPILQSVMKYFVGILAVLLPGQLKYRTKEIVDFLKELKVKKASQWLQYVEESKEETTITQQILQEMGDDWEVEDFAISSTFVNIIRKTRPRQLVLTVVERPLNYPHLQEVLKVCAQSREMKLSLHLYKHFWSEKTDVSDKFLDTVTDGTSLCKLESFAGRLSAQAITKLPSSLMKLALHITPDTLGPLNTLLPSLAALQMLYLNLDASAATDPNEIPSLNLSGRLIVLSLDIWKINEATVEWSCDVAKALSTTYARLVLRRSNLDACGCERWLAELHQRGVTASWVVVGSTCDVTDDNAHLQQCAAKIGCRKFVWIKI